MDFVIISKEDIFKQRKPKDVFKNLKSDYFLIRVFDIIKKNKSLEIIKYNKTLQKRMHLNINDYKEYSQSYSSIEIEIKITSNEQGKYGKFINISDESKKYYHIYIDKSKEELKKKNNKIKRIKIFIDYQVKSLRSLFYNCSCINSICFKKFNRINITDMAFMFFECSSLKELNLSNFNTNNVVDMGYMFFGCSSLKELNLSNFNTSNVTDMSSMFARCSSLRELNISNFNTKMLLI